MSTYGYICSMLFCTGTCKKVLVHISLLPNYIMTNIHLGYQITKFQNGLSNRCPFVGEACTTEDQTLKRFFR